MSQGNEKSEPSRNLFFTHVRLENWRNFVRIDVALQRRAFLVGPNASGKSNFLDAFRFLHDILRSAVVFRMQCGEEAAFQVYGL